MAKKKSGKSTKKSSSKQKAKENARMPLWAPLAILVLLALLVAEVAVLLPPSMAPDAIRPYIEQAQGIVPLPLPETGDPEKALESVRELHERNMERIAADGQAEIDRINSAIEEIRAENKALRNKD